jgi:hypothetical protein
MTTTHANKRICVTLVLLSLIIVPASLALSSNVQVKAQSSSPYILITGAQGYMINYSLAQLEQQSSVSGYGGYYQPNQKQVNIGLWTGVSLLTLVNEDGGIVPGSNITVVGQGTNTFTYSMVNSGTTFNQQYITYNNQTGAVQNQTQPVTLILAYQVNGTDLPSSMQPDPRLIIIGPEGLLMDGSGGRSVTQITVTSPAVTPTPTPTAVPTTAPTAVPTSSPTLTASPILTPSLSPSPTPTIPEFPAFYLAAIMITLVSVSAAYLAVKRR